jgi:hypothetical protein
MTESDKSEAKPVLEPPTAAAEKTDGQVVLARQVFPSTLPILNACSDMAKRHSRSLKPTVARFARPSALITRSQ